MEDIARLSAEADTRNRDRWIGVYIGVLAVVLAVAAMGGDNAAKTATAKNIAAANTWSFFQAKNLRRQIVRTQIENLELTLATSPQLDQASKAALSAKISEYRTIEAKLTSDRESGEGLDELFAKGKLHEAERDRAMAQDPYFDYGQALLQIAIVLASIAIITGGNSLLGLSGLLGMLGILFSANGFALFFTIPWLA